MELASEFRYRKSDFRSRSLVVIVSQSGKQQDSLAALRRAKRSIRTLGNCQCIGSSIAREADNVFTLCGTGNFCSNYQGIQYSADCLLCTGNYSLEKSEEQITEEKYQELIAELKTLPDRLPRSLKMTKSVSVVCS